MRISTHIALHTAALVSAGAILAHLSSGYVTSALDAREQVQNDSRDLESLERFTEGVGHLLLNGDLVLSGGSTYLVAVALEQAESLNGLLDGFTSSPLFAEHIVECAELKSDVSVLAALIESALSIEGADRHDALFPLLDRFDVRSEDMTARTEDLKVALTIDARERSERAEERVASAQTASVSALLVFLAVILGSWLYLQHATASPLRSLAQRVRASAEGDPFEPDGSGPREVLELAATFAELVTNLERARDGLEDTVNERTRELNQALKARSAFLAITSHELRTPMNSLLGFADLLAEGGVDDAQEKECLTQIQASGRHLMSLIEDLLDLSQIDAGQMRLELAPYSPRELIAEVVRILAGAVREKGLTMQVRVEPSVPDFATGDSVRIRQVLINLVSNAIKFTPRGRVRLEAGWSENELRIEVQDTGVGIPSNKLETIFEEFEQVDTSDTREYGGSGLGLPLSLRLARMMKGDLTVKSTPNVGTTFRLSLAAEAYVNPKSLIPGVDEASDVSERRRALLVDDVPTNRLLLRRILQRMEFEVEEAENGREALSIFHAALGRGEPFDAILMDLQMPVMDGYEATSRLRDGGFGGKILAVSAAVLPEQRRRALESGCDLFLKKPVNVTMLRASLEPAPSSAA